MIHEILTPKPSKKPRINGAKIFGVRKNSPFFFKIPATGIKPLIYDVKNLPDGLSINTENGIITGTISKEGVYKTILIVKNEFGESTREFTIKCGEKICLTPPMGWNSWYVHSLWVSQEKIEKMAKAMYDSGLIDHGWTYINIDDCWQGERRKDGNQALQPNDKFPDMKSMCDFIHSLGLKVGIYSGPWIGTYAGYRGSSVPNEDFDYSEYIAPMEDRQEKNQIFGEKGRKKIRKLGIYMGDKDAKQWADWGFDYLKYDWKPNDIKNASKMAEDLKKTGRDMVYSLSNSAPFSLAKEWTEIANVWRTTGDIIDYWIRVSQIGFSQEKWAPFSGPGHWNDPDMLQVGKTAHPHKESPAAFPSHLTDDEQYSQMSLWCLLAAPLLLSCDLEQLDEFTLNLLTNDEVLEINQDPLGIQAICAKKRILIPLVFHTEIYTKDLEDGSVAVGLFNRGKFKSKIKLKLSDLGLNGTYSIRDLWRQQDIGEITHDTFFIVRSHGVKLIKLSKNKI